MTPAIAAILAIGFAVLAALLLPPWLRRKRRKRLLAMPLAPGLRAAVARNVPITRLLPLPAAQRLEGLVNTFLVEKQFGGCNGLVIDDEIRVTVAAQACVLLLGRAGSRYDELQSILVYPSAFWVEDEVEDEHGLVTRRRRELSGEAWDSHRIILAWDDIQSSARSPGDGFNVVLHEFAHYLDAEGRGLATTPLQQIETATPPRSVDAWHADLVSEYSRLVDAVERDEVTWLDPYAAEDEAEFFAVASEEFIELPLELRAANARLYGLLQEFYGIDPAAWHDLAATAPHGPSES